LFEPWIQISAPCQLVLHASALASLMTASLF
jgi:hypothetical protein